MSNNNNNNKQPLDLTEPLLVATGGTATSEPANGLGIPKIEKPVVEASISDVKPDVTTANISHSDEASTSIPIIDRDKSVDETIRFLLDCAKEGKICGNQSPSICRVPGTLRDLSESSFNPQLVSIGPIHREDPKLQEFEWLKKCYLHDILKRCHFRSTPKKTLEACLLKVNTLVPQIRESYAGVKKNYSDSELATMMIIDGCFILEFCFKHEKEDELPNKMQNNRIAMDLMLLENQVPFVVLQALFDCSMGKVSFTLSNVLDEYLAPYGKLFRSLLPEKNSTTDVDSDFSEKYSTIDVDSSDSTYDHVLGYLHKRYQLVAAKASKRHQERIENTAFHSIVELDRSGVNFKPHQEDEWSMKIEFQSFLFACLPCFWSKPTLLMPTLVIGDTTELILRNFIAYEQSFPQARYYFTSYANAMDKVIDSQEDIAKLVKSKVLVNNLGSNQEAANMINKVCKNITYTKFYYTEEFKKIDKYHNRFWPKNIARLRRIYFSNPWSAIALLAGILVFSLTVFQAFSAIMGT